MNKTHRIVRDAHAQRQRRRAAIEASESQFDGLKASAEASKLVLQADEAMLLDTEDLDAFESRFASHCLAFFENNPSIPAFASTIGYEVLRDKSYAAKLYKQLCVGSQALAFEVAISRITSGLEEVIRELSLVRHEDLPAIIDESQLAESDALRERFLAERDSGERVVRERPWLFGKGAGVPPAERKRLAHEERMARRLAALETHERGDGTAHLSEAAE